MWRKRFIFILCSAHKYEAIYLWSHESVVCVCVTISPPLTRYTDTPTGYDTHYNFTLLKQTVRPFRPFRLFSLVGFWILYFIKLLIKCAELQLLCCTTDSACVLCIINCKHVCVCVCCGSDGVLDLSTKKNHSAGSHKAFPGLSSAPGVKG